MSPVMDNLMSQLFNLLLRLNKRSICTVALLFSLSPLTYSATEEESEDFSELSLEELMDIKVDPNIVNVLESHLHKKGEWMFSQRFVHIDMEHNHDGSSEKSTADVLAEYAVSPTEMDMDMHMFSMMYAPSDNVTLMLMAPYMEMSMKHLTRTGINFTTRSKGLGDIKLMSNLLLHRTPRDKHRFSFLSGISLPTGSIDERDDLPTGPNQKLPYPMQLGSGTYDFIVGATYSGIENNWSWGIHSEATVRTGKNDNDYRLGNTWDNYTWIKHGWTDWLSTTVGINAMYWGNIHGADPDLNPLIVPTADPNLRGGRQVDAQLGIELYAPTGSLRGQRLGIDVALPLHKDLDGPQLGSDVYWTVGWQLVY